MSIAVVILAGGEGRRIGGGKPMRLLGGRLLLDHAIARASSWSDAICVAVREPGQVDHPAISAVADEPGLEGPLGGLAAGLRFAAQCEREKLLAIPADSPFLPPDLVPRLERSLVGVAVAVARSGGRLHPACALWRSEVLGLLESYAATGRRSLKGFAEYAGFTAVDWRDEPYDPFFNINTPDDLEAADNMFQDQKSSTSTRSPGA